MARQGVGHAAYTTIAQMKVRVVAAELARAQRKQA